MVTSILGFIFGSFKGEEQQMEYNKHTFTRTGNYWETKVSNVNVKLNFFPTELTDVNVTNDTIAKLKSTKMIYITTPTQGSNLDYISLTAFELADFLTTFQIFPQRGILDNNTNYTLPLINCESATQYVPVIKIENANQTQAYLDGNCIIIEAQYGQDFLRVKDKIILKFLGIM